MNNREWTPEELEMIREAERLINSGELPFVVFRGHRIAVSDEIMYDFGLVSGRHISEKTYESLCAVGKAAQDAQEWLERVVNHGSR